MTLFFRDGLDVRVQNNEGFVQSFQSKKKVVLLSFHVFTSPRRAGFHFIAEELARRDYEVNFITIGSSPLLLLRHADHHASAMFHGVNKWLNIQKNIHSFILYTPYHPVNLRNSFLNNLSKHLFFKYGKYSSKIYDVMKWADIVIYESCPGLLLIPFIRKESHAKWIYRVSDDLLFLKPHPILIESEYDALMHSKFDLVSCPSEPIYNRLKSYSNVVRLHQHGIDMHSYDICHYNPYEGNLLNAIFIGMSHIDINAVEIMAKQFPYVQFHLVGNVQKYRNLPNIQFHGVLPYADTIPYVKFADVGLQTRLNDGDKGLHHSLKVQQYSYAGLPIVGPASLDTGWGNYYGYADDYSDEDVKRAFNAAICSCQNNYEARSFVRSWTKLVDDMLFEVQ